MPRRRLSTAEHRLRGSYRPGRDPLLKLKSGDAIADVYPVPAGLDDDAKIAWAELAPRFAAVTADPELVEMAAQQMAVVRRGYHVLADPSQLANKDRLLRSIRHSSVLVRSLLGALAPHRLDQRAPEDDPFAAFDANLSGRGSRRKRRPDPRDAIMPQ